MNKLPLATLTAFLSLAAPVAAQNGGTDALALIVKIFSLSWLSGAVITQAGLTQEQAYAAVVRFVLWLVVIVTLKSAAGKLKALEGRASGVVAFGVATISALFIPEQLLLTMGQAYGAVLSWFVIGAVVAVIFWMHARLLTGDGLGVRVARLVMMFLIISLLGYVEANVPTVTSGVLRADNPFSHFSTQVLDILLLVAWGVLIFDVIQFFRNNVQLNQFARNYGPPAGRGIGKGLNVGKNIGLVTKSLVTRRKKAEDVVEEDIKKMNRAEHHEMMLDNYHRRLLRLEFNDARTLIDEFNELNVMVGHFYQAAQFVSRIEAAVQARNQVGPQNYQRAQLLAAKFPNYLASILDAAERAHRILLKERQLYTQDLSLTLSSRADMRWLQQLITDIEGRFGNNPAEFSQRFGIDDIAQFRQQHADILQRVQQMHTELENLKHLDDEHDRLLLDQFSGSRLHDIQEEASLVRDDIDTINAVIDRVRSAASVSHERLSASRLAEEIGYVHEQILNLGMSASGFRRLFQQEGSLVQRLAAINNRRQHIENEIHTLFNDINHALRSP